MTSPNPPLDVAALDRIEEWLNEEANDEALGASDICVALGEPIGTASSGDFHRALVAFRRLRAQLHAAQAELAATETEIKRLGELESWNASLADAVNTWIREAGGINYAQAKGWHPRDIKHAVDALAYRLNDLRYAAQAQRRERDEGPTRHQLEQAWQKGAIDMAKRMRRPPLADENWWPRMNRDLAQLDKEKGDG